MALANEVLPFGVEVCCVQPGDIKTNFTSARRKVAEGDDIYGGRIGHSVRAMEESEKNGMFPEKAGAFIRQVATQCTIDPIFTIGQYYEDLCERIKKMPTKELNELIAKKYAQ